MGKLLTSPRSPEHIPVRFLRMEAGDGGGRRLGSKNEFAAQSKTTQPRRGERRSTHARSPARWGLSAATPGVNRRPGSLPNCLAGTGVGGGAAHARSRQLGTPMGVWMSAGLVGFPQSTEVTHGLGGWAWGLLRAQVSCRTRFRRWGDKCLGGPGRNSIIRETLTPTRAHLGIDRGGILTC